MMTTTTTTKTRMSWLVQAYKIHIFGGPKKAATKKKQQQQSTDTYTSTIRNMFQPSARQSFIEFVHTRNPREAKTQQQRKAESLCLSFSQIHTLVLLNVQHVRVCYAQAHTVSVTLSSLFFHFFRSQRTILPLLYMWLVCCWCCFGEHIQWLTHIRNCSWSSSSSSSCVYEVSVSPRLLQYIAQHRWWARARTSQPASLLFVHKWRTRYSVSIRWMGGTWHDQMKI